MSSLPYTALSASDGPTRASETARRFRMPRPSQALLILSAILLVAIPVAFHQRHAIAPSYFQPAAAPSHIVTATGGLPDSLGVPLTLEARLGYLLSRPALAQWEMELPNRKACPFYTYSRNTYFFHTGKEGQWESVSADDVTRYRQKMVEYLRQVERSGDKLVWDPSMEKDVPRDQRRGIITTGGSAKSLARLEFSLHMLRNVLHCKLPIEIYHYPDEMQDEAVKAELIKKYNVKIVLAKFERRYTEKSWSIKNTAFHQTNFTEFIYLDSDNIPLADPAELFESVEYKQSGHVFWPDLEKDHPDNAIFRVLGRECSDDHWAAEAGQIVFDKRGNNGLNLAILHLSTHMMTNEDMYHFMSYGDKDTFRYAFYALGLNYQQAPRQFAAAGGFQTIEGESSDEFCGHSLLHWGLTPQSEKHNPNYHPKPAFLHTILAKGRQHQQHDKLFSHIRRPRLDGILEPRLVRTLYEFTFQCFAITLKGPDGAPEAGNSYGDGQGIIMQEMKDLLQNGPVYQYLRQITPEYQRINDAP